MVRLLLILVSLLFVIILAFMFVVISIPERTYREQVEKAASQALDRPVTLTGKTSLSLFPEIAVSVDGLKVANPDGFSAPYLLETGTAKARIKLWPLIDRRVEVAEVSLSDASIHLERLANGQTNWTSPTSTDATPPDNTETPDNAGSSRSPAQTGSAAINRATLSNCQIRYIDHVDGLDYSLANFNADARLRAGLEAFSLIGSGTLQGIDFAIDLSLDPIPALITGRPAALSLRLESVPANITFDGKLNEPELGYLDGELSIGLKPNVLAAALTMEQPPSALPQAFNLLSTVSGSAENFEFSSMLFDLDTTRGTGTLNIDLGTDRPAIRGDLHLNQLDLTPYLGNSTGPAAAGSGSSAWSDVALPFDSLALADAALAISFDLLVLDQIRLTNGRLASTLDNGRLSLMSGTEADTTGFRAFGGEWTSRLYIDAARSNPTVNLRASGRNINANQLAGTFLDYRGISGTGEFSMDLNASGTSLDRLISRLNGSAEAKLANGKLSGINITQLVHTGDDLITALRSGSLDSSLIASAIGRGSETDFTSLLTRLRLDNGTAHISNLDLVNPALSVSGTGSIDLKSKRLDVRLQPTLRRQQADQNISLGLGGTPIPVRIRGDWASPQISPDLDIIETQFRDRAADRLTSELQSLLSRRNSDSSDGETGSDSESPEEAILNTAIGALFRR